MVHHRVRTCLMSILVAIFILAVVPVQSNDVPIAYSIAVSPHKIVLNAQGNADSIQVIVSMPGSTVEECAIDLLFDDELVASTTSARYCLVDDNLLIYFDREAILENETVQGMAGTTVTATITGWVDFGSGRIDLADITKSDEVEIVKPGKMGHKSLTWASHRRERVVSSY